MGVFAAALKVIHRALSTTATCDGESFLVIDKTKGIEVEMPGSKIPTIVPACAVRVEALVEAGFTTATMVGKTLTFNSRSWYCYNWKPAPTPEGEDSAEVYLLLRKAP